MKHHASPEDDMFRRELEACETLPSEFDHRAHVRLAYIYLCADPVDAAHRRMKQSLLCYLSHIGAGESKYHETITRFWIMVVSHFMTATPVCRSAAQFIDRNPKLLDTGIVRSHYSTDVLFSPRARERFVPPDLRPIPRP